MSYHYLWRTIRRIKNLIFIRQIPDLKGYLEATLSDFFQVKREALLEMEKLNLHNDEND